MFSRRTTHCFAENNAVSLPEIFNSKILNSKKFKGYFPISYPQMLKSALKEDINGTDITSFYLIPKNKTVRAEIRAKETGVLSCLFIVRDIYLLINKNIKISFNKKDGDEVKNGDVIAVISGPADSILKGERVALNFLQHFSGIATLSNKFNKMIKPHSVKILDTRKTMPLYRFLEKYSVKAGGCFNHRFGLDDMILIKENHIKINNGITKIFELLKKKAVKNKLVEIEVQNIKELIEAIHYSPDIIMLDNMKISDMKKARGIVPEKIKLEASGNINLNNVKQIARTGVDYISIGAITHSAKALDMSLIIK
ncbi:MAG: carboxylating nicotinate-nucleotide diphosphorylase [bacterium]|nr:carboxylating nicotinate-nucleotide diphosphorylase [bacterium]